MMMFTEVFYELNKTEQTLKTIYIKMVNYISIICVHVKVRLHLIIIYSVCVCSKNQKINVNMTHVFYS